MIRSSLLASLNGALAGVAGKIAFGSGWLPDNVVVRVAGVATLLALNALLFHFMALGFGSSQSTVQVTSVVTAGNFVLTGVFGWLVFGEMLSAAWVGGVALMAAGVWLLSGGGGP